MRGSWIVLTTSVLFFAISPITARADESDHADHPHQFIRITSGRLYPEVQHIHPNDAFGWINYSSKIARVSFEKDVAKHLTCSSPGSFRLTGERYESGDIQARQFASLCKLAPGEYPYRVDLVSGIGGVGGGAPLRHEGRIIVE